MGRETQRRLALIAVVGTVAAGSVVTLQSGTVTPVANAAASPTLTPAPAPAPMLVSVSVARVAACPFPASLRSAFETAARDASIPPAMLYAVAKVESNLREDAQSAAGARGLLQVMPETAKSLALNVDEPSSNVLAGARYLRQMLDRFGSSDLALAAYNAGPTAVYLAGGAPSIGVQRYISNVNALWHSVAGCR